MYGGGSTGRAIVFTETKNEANELALGDKLGKNACQVLHGDIAQKQREITLQAFRDGKVRALIATDVAARVSTMHIFDNFCVLIYSFRAWTFLRWIW